MSWYWILLLALVAFWLGAALMAICAAAGREPPEVPRKGCR